LGTFLIEKTKQEYQSEFEKITTLKINQLKNELEQLNTEIKSKQNEIIELTNQTQKLNKTKNNMEKETTTLINNKEIIYETIKAIMKCNITNNENQFIKPNIYTENADLPENDFLDSEFEFSLVNKNTKSILINKFSLVPSVSYVYTIANALGNSKVLNLSVEYDWLHYSDFVKHGLLDFIIDSHNNTDTFYFINFDNINIIPMECGFSSIFKVFNREKPYFEGTTQKMPNNLFITATILPTKKETNIGHPLPSNLKTIFKGIDNPNNIEPLNFTSVKKDREFKYLFSKKLINDLLKKTADNLENICSPDTMSDYYEY
jgi:formate dehydrogenase maturation protein FdhE